MKRKELSTLLRTGAVLDAPEHLSDSAWQALLDGRVPESGLSEADEPLLEWYRPIVEAGGRLVIAQLGQSIDGFIASRTGDSCFVTGEADRTHLHRMRALVDAVVVGAQTVVADDCQLTVRAVTGRNPVRVVVDPTARVPRHSKVLTDGLAPTLWLVADDAQLPLPLADHVEVLRIGPVGKLSPQQVLGLLAARGLGRVLVEGGGVTVSDFLQARALDRLLITTAPLIIGDGIPGIRFSGTDALSGALAAPTRRMRFGGDLCTDFDFSVTD